jgi:phytanoyl-CoA hydroxylase
VPVAPAGAYIGWMVSDGQVADFHRDGFLVLEGFVSPAACAAARERAEEIVDAFEPASHRTVFTTNEQVRVSDELFLSSGDAITCFFEEEAIGPDGELTVPKARSINKIGHALHDLDPVFERFSYTPELAEVAAAVGLDDALALQSMYIFKQPSIGGEVGCHQDATFLWTDPVSVVGFWFALEDATLENGCLWAAPGGHRGPLRQLFRRAPAGGTEMVTLDETPLPRPPGELQPLPVPAGTMIVLDGLLPHWSDANRSPGSRHAYSLHCISAKASYPATNWLQRGPDMPLRPLAAHAAELRQGSAA